MVIWQLRKGQVRIHLFVEVKAFPSIGLPFECVRKRVSVLISLILSRTGVNVVNDIHIFIFGLVIGRTRD